MADLITLTKHAIFAALHKGIVRASLLLSECNTEKEVALLSAFIARASMHIRKIKLALDTQHTDSELCDISFEELIKNEALIRDLKEKAGIVTVADIFSSDQRAFYAALDLDHTALMDRRNPDHQSYDEAQALREVVFAMRPSVIGIVGRITREEPRT